MRLQEVHIHKYHVLDNFTLYFSDDNSNEDEQIKSLHALDLIVGVNGSGKSSLLRALAEIFQALYREDQEELPPFGFRVKYQLQGKSKDLPNRTITISNLDENNRPRLEKNLLLQEDTEKREVDHIDREYLPAWVIALTSGSESGWKLSMIKKQSAQSSSTTVAEQPADRYRYELANVSLVEKQNTQGNPGKSRYLFMNAELMPLVVLCGLLQDMSQQGRVDRPQFIDWAMRECKLKSLCGFSLKFRMNISDPPDRFVEALRSKAQQSIQRGADHLLVFSLAPNVGFVANTSKPQDILAIEGTGINFFEKLADMYRPDTIAPVALREVNLFFATDRGQQNEGKEASHSPLLLFDWLSDGEQSFLGRLCLFALLEPNPPQNNVESGEEGLASEALILLDEPEVHFNDYWKRQLVHILTEAVQKTPRHILMTTHSSITLSDVADKNVWILQRENGYTTHADLPNIPTLGADPSDILVSVFRAENAVGAQSVAYIRQTIREARTLRHEKQEETARKKLKKLHAKLGPGYWRYLVLRELDNLEKEGEPN